jgi:hypothetical protein
VDKAAAIIDEYKEWRKKHNVDKILDGMPKKAELLRRVIPSEFHGLCATLALLCSALLLTAVSCYCSQASTSRAARCTLRRAVSHWRGSIRDSQSWLCIAQVPLTWARF